jgi:AcrR family transcriptional regulator
MGPDRSSYHHGDLRKALLDISVGIIEKKGVQALNLRTVASLAGVSSGAPYHHFSDRTQLISAIANEGFEILEASMLSAIQASGNSADARLELLGQAYVRFAISHSGHFRVMFRTEDHSQTDIVVTASGDRVFQLLCDAIEESQAQGTIPRGDPQPFVLLAWTAIHGLSVLLLDGGLKKITYPPENLAPLMTTLIKQLFAALADQAAKAMMAKN